MGFDPVGFDPVDNVVVFEFTKLLTYIFRIFKFSEISLISLGGSSVQMGRVSSLGVAL